MTAKSSNSALISNEAIQIAGVGPNRTVTVRPTPGQAGSATITLTLADGDGASVEGSFLVQVQAAPPEILTPKSEQTVLIGGSVGMVVGARGTAPLSYQWLRNGGPIAGATNATLNLTGARPADAGTYAVTVANRAGSVTGDIVALRVDAELGITREPLDQAVVEGSAATFVVVAAGTGPFTYQWKFNGQPIAGANSDSLVLSNAQSGQAGFYSVDVTGLGRTVPSRSAQLTIQIGPRFVSQPVDQSVLAGSPVILTAVASGSEPLRYQWRFNGANLAGATGSELALSTVEAAQAGVYDVVVSNAVGSATSSAATVGVNTPVQISVKGPSDLLVATGDPVSFSLSATGSGSLTYQWFFEDQAIVGATGPDLVLAAARRSDAGRYQVVVRNAAGPVAGPEARLQVIDPLIITVQPQGQSIKRGEAATFNVGVSGTGPFGYSWQVNGVTIRQTVSGSLVLPGVDSGAAGSYRVIVTNAVSSAASELAVLKVLGPPSLSPLPEIIRTNQTADVTFTIKAEGAPPFQYQWIRNGVNIPGATNDTYTIRNVQPKDGGNYSVVVTDSGGAITSNTSSLIVITPPLAVGDRLADASLNTAPEGTFSGSNAGASSEPGEPSHAPGKPARRSVWFAWKAPGDGILAMDTAGSGFDTIVAVYTGRQDDILSLSQVASDGDGDSGSYLASALSFNVTAGTTYYVAIDGFDGVEGNFNVQWKFEATKAKLPLILRHPISHNVFVGTDVAFAVTATNVSGGPLLYQWNLDGVPIPGATNVNLILRQVKETDVGHYNLKVRDPEEAGREVASLDAILEVNLIETGSEGPGIEVVDKLGATSQTGQQVVVKSVARRRASTEPSALELRGFRGSKAFSTRLAAKDAGEPNHCRTTGGASVWFIYKGVTNAVLRFSTEGSDYDTVLGVYTGPSSSYATMQEVTCDDNSGFDGKSSVVLFPTVRGTTYYIAVDGVNGAKGLVRFKYEVAAPAVVGVSTFGKVNPATCLPLADLTDLKIQPGDSVKFSAAAANPLAPVDLTFQWRVNGFDVTGSSDPALCVKNLTSRDQGEYVVVVGNFSGGVTSAPVRLDFSQPVALLATLENQTVVAGSTARLAVVADGTGPLAYRWSYEGTVLPGETNATLTLAGVRRAQAGRYSVDVSNPNSSARSLAVLTVAEAPVIAVQPVSSTVAAGSMVQLTGSASGTAPLSYQWLFNGVIIPGATTPVLTLSGVQSSAGGEYRVAVTNPIGSISSDPALVRISAPLSIILQPVNQTVVEGGEVTFLVAATGTVPLRYQWRLNGQDLPGATGARLDLNSVQPKMAGTYLATVSDANETIDSLPATLGVITAPTIVEAPRSQSVGSKSPASFSVRATGTEPLTYQWRLNGTALADATEPILVLTNVTAQSLGAYTVLVQNEAGSVVSAPAILDLQTAPQITRQPTDGSATVGGSTSFTVTATGTAPLAYQWRFNGEPIVGATNDTLVLPKVQESQGGQYQVLVRNPAGSLLSQEVGLCVATDRTVAHILSVRVQPDGTSRLLFCGMAGTKAYLQASTDYKVWTVLTNFTFRSDNLYDHIDLDAPANRWRAYQVAPLFQVKLQNQPADQSVAAGTAATLNVAAAGSAPFAYQWFRNGATLIGATHATLVLTNVQPDQAGAYQVRVTNQVGLVSSQEAQLCVRTDEKSASILSVRLLPDRATARVVICGPAGQDAVLQGSRDLAGWVVLTNFTFASNLYEYFDPEAGLYPYREYKVAPRQKITITQSPLDEAVPVGASVTKRVAVAGTGPFSYQWSHQGQVLPGATNATLVLTNVQAAQSGAYRVRVTNELSKVTSPEAYLCVLGADHAVHVLSVNLLTNGTVSRVLICGPADTNGVLQASAGSTNWTFLTRFTIPGGNLFEYFDTEAARYPDREYKVAPVRRVSILEQPLDQAARVGASVRLSVAAEGTGPFTFQWRHAGKDLPGATNALLVLANVQAADAGSYQVRVRNLAGTVVSDEAQVCLVTDDTVRILSVRLLSDHTSARVMICGPSGKRGVLQGSRDLTSWTALTNFTFRDEIYQYVDPEAGKLGWRYFKVAPPSIKVGRGIPAGPGQFEFAIGGAGATPADYEGLRSIVRVSNDLQSWVPLSTNVISNGQIKLTDPDALRSPYRFYQFGVQP